MTFEWRAALDAELGHWARSGRRARFWLRDDDAIEASAALERLLTITSRHNVPLALAVIPAHCSDGLAVVLRDAPHVQVIQHGWSHENHAQIGLKKSEFPSSRVISDVAADLLRGIERLGGMFGSRFAPVLAPPWNRMAEPFFDLLPKIGFLGVSLYRQGQKLAAPGNTRGIRRIDCHADPINWKQDASFAGAESTVRSIIDHLVARREGVCDADEPTGLLTHHLRHKPETAMFLDELIGLLATHPAASWLDATCAFGKDQG